MDDARRTRGGVCYAMTLPANLILEKNKPNAESAWVLLIEAYLTDGTILRYARAHADITFDSNTYTAIAIGLDARRLNSTGEIPTLNLVVHDVGLVIRPYLRTLNGAIGSTVRLIVVNTENLAENYSELTVDFDVLQTWSRGTDVTFQLGPPTTLSQRFPLERDYALFCQFRMRDPDMRVNPECGYTDETVTGCTLPSGNPVRLTVTAHPFSTGDSLYVADVGGITPSLDDTYDITKVDANTISLDGTDGDDYSGPYTSGGTAGYSDCSRTLTACQERENSTRFGGAPGLQQGGLRIA